MFFQNNGNYNWSQKALRSIRANGLPSWDHCKLTGYLKKERDDMGSLFGEDKRESPEHQPSSKVDLDDRTLVEDTHFLEYSQILNFLRYLNLDLQGVTTG